jgi:hypothetical protein
VAMAPSMSELTCTAPRLKKTGTDVVTTRRT